MSEQELILNVRELHLISLACANCGHGTTFDFETKDYLEKSVTPQCSVCSTELEVDLREQLQAYRCFYDSMSKCACVEFRVRLTKTEAAASVSDLQHAVASALEEHDAAGAVASSVSRPATPIFS